LDFKVSVEECIGFMLLPVMDGELADFIRRDPVSKTLVGLIARSFKAETGWLVCPPRFNDVSAFLLVHSWCR
jgi:hypothetical protein